MDVSRSSRSTTSLPVVRTFVIVWPVAARSKSPLIGEIAVRPHPVRSDAARQSGVTRTTDARQNLPVALRVRLAGDSGTRGIAKSLRKISLRIRKRKLWASHANDGKALVLFL